MSIVGTRPPLISETNLYEPHHKAIAEMDDNTSKHGRQMRGQKGSTLFRRKTRMRRNFHSLLPKVNKGGLIKIHIKLNRGIILCLEPKEAKTAPKSTSMHN